MDWSSVGVQTISALTPIVVMVALWAVKLGWAKVPASLVVFAAPVLGMLANFGLNYLAGHQAADPAVAAALGALAVFLRELISTLATKGVTGPISTTKISF